MGKSIWRAGRSGGNTPREGHGVNRKHSANAWDSTHFASTERKAKFLRLMGGQSVASTSSRAAETTDAAMDETRRRGYSGDGHALVDQELQRLYEQGLHQAQAWRRGLGAESAALVSE